MARYNTNKYIHVDTIQAYPLNWQYSSNHSYEPSIGHSYDNLAHNHLTCSLMASARSHISRWPDNVGRRRKGTNSKNQPRTDIQSIDNNCHVKRLRHNMTITNYSRLIHDPNAISEIKNDVVWAFKALSEDNVHIRVIKLNHQSN